MEGLSYESRSVARGPYDLLDAFLTAYIDIGGFPDRKAPDGGPFSRLCDLACHYCHKKDLWMKRAGCLGIHILATKLTGFKLR